MTMTNARKKKRRIRTDYIPPNVGVGTGFRRSQPIYIDELARILDRRIGTIRRWHTDGRLPKGLKPKRGTRRRRYWTRTQVYKKGGLIDWMKANDMRPGNRFTPRSKEAAHIANLRKPKYLAEEQIIYAGQLADRGKTRIEIGEALLPETRYRSVNSIDVALMRAFRDRGWDLPPLYLKRRQLYHAHRMQQGGADFTKIVRHLRHQTQYTSLLALEREVRRLFKLYGWEEPYDDEFAARKRHADRRLVLSKEHLAEIRAMERQLRAIEAISK